MHYADVPGMDLTSRCFEKARRVAKEPEVIPDAGPSSKKTRLDEPGKHSFFDSPSIIQGLYCQPIASNLLTLILGSILATESEHALTVLRSAEKLLKEGDLKQLDELSTRRLIGELQAEIICDLHKINFILKRRTFLLQQLDLFQRSLEFAQEPSPETVS